MPLRLDGKYDTAYMEWMVMACTHRKNKNIDKNITANCRIINKICMAQ